MTVLQRKMRERGLSKAKLAVYIGRGASNMNAAWNGYGRWFPAWRRDISLFFGVPESDLFDENEKLIEEKEGQDNG